METRRAQLAQMLRPWSIRTCLFVLGAAGSYDVGCNQFGWPKIPELWGMTGSLMPLWGWLLALHAVFMAALFEYVRRNIGPVDGGGVEASPSRPLTSEVPDQEPIERITEADAKACNLAIHELSGCLVGQMREALKLVYPVASEGPETIKHLGDIPSMQQALQSARMHLQDATIRHELAVCILKIDFQRFWTGLSQLEMRLSGLYSARDWPEIAVYDKIMPVNEANNETEAARNELIQRLTEAHGNIADGR